MTDVSSATTPGARPSAHSRRTEVNRGLRDLPEGPLYPTSQFDQSGEFEEVWGNPRFTRVELPPVDVNRVLAERYRASEPLTFTATMLWDLEVRKAWRPDIYIPGVVAPGSAAAWGRHTPDGRAESFARSSHQRLWLEPDEYGLVLEQPYVEPSERKIIFIGAATLPDRDGSTLHATTKQPLFHVEHSVGGEETRPLNRWRIVHLTDGPDNRLIERLTRIASDLWLPEFVEIYIRGDLAVGLTRRDPR